MGPAIIAALLALEAEPAFRLELTDPASDDHGPGGYVYPSDALVYKRGAFDLRGLTVEVEGDAVVISVTLGQPIKRPARVRRSNATEIPLHNNVYLQNVDIYIDREPGAGFTETVPGRNVDIAAEHAWDTAVVLTPQPALTRSMLGDWKPSARVVFPENVVAVGGKLSVKIDATELGGFPKAEWGWQVLVTGALWEPSFDVVRRFVNDQGINAFTMLVQTLPEPEAFGGGEVELIHPMVIDLLAPRGASQEAILGGYDKTAKRRAVVPLVYPHAKPVLALPKVEKPPPAEWIDLVIRDVQGETVVLERAGHPIEPYRMGDVLDASGQAVCRLVITSVHPEFALATAVGCGAALRTGAITRFEKKVR